MKWLKHLSPTQQRIFSNVSWSLAGKMVNLLSALLVGIFVARYLGPRQYGTMNYVVSFVSMFLIIATFGFENIEIREEARHNDQKNLILGTVFRLRLVLSAFTIALVALVAWLSGEDRSTFALIMLYALSVILSPFDVIRNYFTSIVQNEYVIKVGMLRSLLSCSVKLVLLLTHASLPWFVGSLVFDAAVLAQGYCYVYNKKVGSMRQWHYSREWACFLLRQSFPLLLSGAAATIFAQIDQVMLGHMVNKASVGYFAVATKFVEILVIIPTIIIQTVTPVLVRVKQTSVGAYRRKCMQFLDVTVWGCLLAGILMALCAYPLVYLAFGTAYLPAVVPLSIMSFKIVGVTLNMVSGQILIIDGRQKWFVLRALSGCVVCVLLNLWVIPRYGVVGVAAITIITQFVAGYLIHLFIPPYRYMFYMQSRSLLLGWRGFYLTLSDLLNKRKENKA